MRFAHSRLLAWQHSADIASCRSLFVGVVLVAWEAAARSGRWSKLLFPSLESIFRELGLFFTKTEMLAEMPGCRSSARSAASRSPPSVGILLGMLMGRSKLVAALLDPLFSGTYAVPKLALFPIFIFVFGIGSLSKVALVFLECLYPIVVMTYAGARDVQPGSCSGRRRTWAPRAPRSCAAW